MRHRRLAIVLLGCLFGSQAVLAEDYEYEGKKVKGVKFDKEDACTISLGDKSDVKGEFKRSKGTIDVSVDGESSLEIRGECHRVVITKLNNKSKVHLKHLKVGAGGVLIKSVSGISRLTTGECTGTIDIRSISGISVLSCKKGSKIEGEENLQGLSRIEDEDGKNPNEGYSSTRFDDKLIRWKIIGASNSGGGAGANNDRCTLNLNFDGKKYKIVVTKKAIEYEGKTIPLKRTAKKIDVIGEVGEDLRILVDGRQVYPTDKK